jgi:hypothetical protein
MYYLYDEVSMKKEKKATSDIRVYVSEEEKKIITSMAAAAQTSVNDFVRRRVFGEPIFSDPDNQFKDMKNILAQIKNDMRNFDQREQLVDARRELYLVRALVYRLLLSQYRDFSSSGMSEEDKLRLRENQVEVEKYFRKKRDEAYATISLSV